MFSPFRTIYNYYYFSYYIPRLSVFLLLILIQSFSQLFVIFFMLNPSDQAHYRYIVHTSAHRSYLNNFIFLSYSYVTTANNISLVVNFFLYYYFNFMFILVSNVLSFIPILDLLLLHSFMMIFVISLTFNYLFSIYLVQNIPWIQLLSFCFIALIYHGHYNCYFIQSKFFLIFVTHNFVIWYDLFAI